MWIASCAVELVLRVGVLQMRTNSVIVEVSGSLDTDSNP